ncbi:MAG: rod shape-determining protein MreD [Rhodospirillaceae bacterium]|nr:rod shape-determining protein MreD [Rhodospirillaceae bacterium]
MKPGFLQRLDLIARGSTPFVLTALLIVMSAIPTRIPEFAHIAPMLPLMAIYHWSIYRPDLLPAWAVFIAGLMQDALVGTPFGVNALVFLAVHMVVLSQQVFFTGKSFAVVWIGFAMVSAAAFVLTWALVSGFFGQSTGLMNMFFQYLVTLGTFPVLTWMLMLWQQRMLTTE